MNLNAELREHDVMLRQLVGGHDVIPGSRISLWAKSQWVHRVFD